MADVLIFGAGSMGTVLGAYLSKAGLAADLVTRDKDHVQALKTAGAKISGTVSFSAPPFDGRDGRGEAMIPSEIKKKYGIIFLITKQQDNVVTAALLKNFITPDGVLCSLQNGIPEPALAEILGKDKVLGCMCAWGANKTAPGCVDLTSDQNSLTFGLGSMGDTQHPKINEVRAVLEKMCAVTTENNFIGVRWSKLLINAAFSGMSAVTGFNFGKIAAGKRSRDCALNVIKECIDVCKAAKITIEPVQGKDMVRLFYYTNGIQKLKASLIVPIAIRKHKAITSSMLPDLDRGRLCEIDDINGVVCSWGKKHGVPTPVNDKIVDIVHAIERGERKYGPSNLDLF